MDDNRNPRWKQLIRLEYDTNNRYLRVESDYKEQLTIAKPVGMPRIVEQVPFESSVAERMIGLACCAPSHANAVVFGEEVIKADGDPISMAIQFYEISDQDFRRAYDIQNAVAS